MNPNERHACRPPFKPPHLGFVYRCPRSGCGSVWTGSVYRSLGAELDELLNRRAGQLIWTGVGRRRQRRTR